MLSGDAQQPAHRRAHQPSGGAIMHGGLSAVRWGEKGRFGATAARPFERRTARCPARRLNPAQKAKLRAQKVANILENAELVFEYRQSFCNQNINSRVITRSTPTK